MSSFVALFRIIDPPAPTVEPTTDALSPSPSPSSVQHSNIVKVCVIGVCPCCGDEGKKLIYRIGQGVMAVMISANRDFRAQLEAVGVAFLNGGKSIMACQKCKVLGSNAVKAAKEKYPDVSEFRFASSTKLPPIETKRKITCGAMSMVYFIF